MPDTEIRDGRRLGEIQMEAEELPYWVTNGEVCISFRSSLNKALGGMRFNGDQYWFGT